MINILELIEQEQANGYSAANASAKICQDLVLRALASGPLNRNVTEWSRKVAETAIENKAV